MNKTESFGIKVQISDWIKPLAESFPIRAKCSALYAVNTLAKHEALENGFDDALLLDVNGNIGELSSANIFFVKDNQVFTPQTDFILNGITRQFVMAWCRETGYQVTEKNIRPDEMKEYDSCFITGTAVEIKPISRIDNIDFTENTLVQNIQEAYKELAMNQNAALNEVV